MEEPKDLLDAFGTAETADQLGDDTATATMESDVTATIEERVAAADDSALEVDEAAIESELAAHPAEPEIAEVPEVVAEPTVEELAQIFAVPVQAPEPEPEVEEPSAEALADADLVSVEDAAVETADASDASSETAQSPFDRPGHWFVCHTYAGYENKVKTNLESRIKSMNMEESIYECIIPMEDVIEFKNGKKTIVKKKVFPGYLLVRCNLDDDAWYVVRNTPGVTGFVGGGNKPTPLSRKEVENILGSGEVAGAPGSQQSADKKARPRLDFDEGETVRVVAGPFADFNGAISEIDVDRSKLKVMVNIFGRETPVELEFGQVAKL